MPLFATVLILAVCAERSVARGVCKPTCVLRLTPLKLLAYRLPSFELPKGFIPNNPYSQLREQLNSFVYDRNVNHGGGILSKFICLDTVGQKYDRCYVYFDAKFGRRNYIYYVNTNVVSDNDGRLTLEGSPLSRTVGYNTTSEGKDIDITIYTQARERSGRQNVLEMTKTQLASLKYPLPSEGDYSEDFRTRRAYFNYGGNLFVIDFDLDRYCSRSRC